MTSEEMNRINTVANVNITEYGFTILAGGGIVEGQMFNYVYTLGLVDKVIPEIILTADIPDFLVFRLLKFAVDGLESNKLIVPDGDDGLILTLGDFKTKKNESRFKLIRLDTVSSQHVLESYMPMVSYRFTKERTEPNGVYQLVVSDANNILPGEAGYDTDYIQPVLLEAAFAF